ncbi:hypothetical protein CEP54_009948 [Fusarium duplospermum]|uniref:G domain-containing protein n=1 Tax=Fusarium duplospermum TaxID=1325734 RepID=A0A428PMZ6_9HYPO|nr:hypothetical protein CEP54_009948 [Fusarium duplospermum]
MTLTSSKPMAPPSGPDKADSSSPPVGLPDDGTPMNDVHSGEDDTRFDVDSESTDSEESLGYKPDPDAVSGSTGKWGYERLCGLLKQAKGAASKPVLNFIKNHMGGTKLIFVMGQAGTGKTTILEELTGIDLGVGHTSSSGTRQYQVCPAIIHGEQYLFVDTAGFGAADLNNMSNFHDIMACVTALGPFVTIAGVLFVYGFPKQRFEAQDMQTVRWIQCFCGPEFFSNITIVTTQWDAFCNKGSFRSHWKRFGDMLQKPDLDRIVNPPGRFHGGKVYYHSFPEGRATADSYNSMLWKEEEIDSEKRGDELRNLIRSRYSNAKPAKLQILHELKQKTPLNETQAAKVLQADVTESEILIVDNRAILSFKDVPRVSETGQGSVDAGSEKEKEKRSASPDSKTSKDGSKASNKKQTHPPAEEPSLYKRITGWLVIAGNVAEYFMKARSQRHESTNRKGASQGPMWSFVSSIKDWWFSSGKK